mgnify:CR=1 FL=1
MENILSLLSNIVKDIPPIVFFFITFFIGIFVYWRACVETRKNRSSIFDTFLISVFLSVIVSRISYIILNWDSFSRYIWYWLPYEKYGNEIYLFRLLPWRFFGIWDGGIVLISLFISFILITTLLVIFYKKWRWKQMFFPIYLSALSMLSFSFVSIGIEQNNISWILQGVLILFFLILVSIVYNLLNKKISKIKKKKSLFSWIGIISVLISSAYVMYIYLSIEISMLERINIYIFVTWVIISCVFFLVDLQRANVSIEKFSSVSSISVIDINQPIKLPRK